MLTSIMTENQEGDKHEIPENPCSIVKNIGPVFVQKEKRQAQQVCWKREDFG